MVLVNDCSLQPSLGLVDGRRCSWCQKRSRLCTGQVTKHSQEPQDLVPILHASLGNGRLIPMDTLKWLKALTATSKAGNTSAQGNAAFYKRSIAVIVMSL